MKRHVLCGLIIALSGICNAGEAVSGPNGKVGFSGGNMNGETGRNYSGSFSFPLGTNFGAQVDGLFTDVSQRDFYGMGGHLFWRDSEKGLLGLTAAGLRENEVLDSWSAGVEGEYYFEMVTLGLKGGAANINYETSAPFFDTDKTDAYATGEVGIYPIDNLYMALSHTRVFDNYITQGNIEYQTPVPGFSLFADLAWGNNDYDHALVGLRYYFGAKKSLKLRHREDDPPSILQDLIFNIGSYGAEFNKKTEEYIEAQGGNGSSGGNYYGSITVIAIGAPPDIGSILIPDIGVPAIPGTLPIITPIPIPYPGYPGLPINPHP